MTARFSEDQIDAGRRLFGGPSRFLLGVAKLEQLPQSAGVEIAFAGRSNVGKSSLINALTGVNGLARASNTPGRTRELNFFDDNHSRHRKYIALQRNMPRRSKHPRLRDQLNGFDCE